jgi:hypothetical protein
MAQRGNDTGDALGALGGLGEGDGPAPVDD